MDSRTKEMADLLCDQAVISVHFEAAMEAIQENDIDKLREIRDVYRQDNGAKPEFIAYMMGAIQAMKILKDR